MLSILNACATGIPTVATLNVKNDVGEPVPALSIRGVLDSNPLGISNEFTVMTDSNGVAVVKGELYNKLRVWLEKDGYYKMDLKTGLATQNDYLTLKKWEPEFDIQFRRIRNPIPLFVQRVENPHVSTRTPNNAYNTNGFSQYDLLKADFLPPYGQGEVVDMEFAIKMDIHKWADTGWARDYDIYFSISIPNGADGIMRGEPYGTGSQGSSFKSDYEVPLEGYTNEISYYTKRRYTGLYTVSDDTNNDAHMLYYFRVRTQTNELGQVTNAYYGKIYGRIDSTFTYYLNPTPNDRNIEYDRKNNLNPKDEARRSP